MSKLILFVVEEGPDLEPIRMFIPIAKRFLSRGFSAAFAIPDIGALTDIAIYELERLRFRCFRISQEISRLYRNSCDSNCSLSARNSSSLSLRDFWYSFLAEMQPKIVVGSRSLVSLSSANRLGISSVSIDAGYLLSEYNVAEDVFGNEAIRNLKRCVFQASVVFSSNESHGDHNQLISDRATNLVGLNMLYEDIWPTILRDNFSWHGGYDCGMCEDGYWEPWDKSPKIFAELNLEYDGALAIIESIFDVRELEVVIRVPDVSSELSKRFSRDRFRFEKQLFGDYSPISRADVVLCHGGASLVATSLLAGKPLAILPSSIENKLLARKVSNLKACVTLPQGASWEVYRKYIIAILGNHHFTAAARAFSYSHQPINLDILCDEIIDSSQ